MFILVFLLKHPFQALTCVNIIKQQFSKSAHGNPEAPVTSTRHRLANGQQAPAPKPLSAMDDMKTSRGHWEGTSLLTLPRQGEGTGLSCTAVSLPHCTCVPVLPTQATGS